MLGGRFGFMNWGENGCGRMSGGTPGMGGAELGIGIMPWGGIIGGPC